MSKYKIKSEHSGDKYIVTGVAVVLIIVGLIAVWISTANPSSPTETATSTGSLSTTTISTATTTTTGPVPAPGDSRAVGLAKFLAQNKITMYGAAWCAHCQDQKKAFGSAWQYVPYVECPDNVQLCISKLVESYPTWLKSDGTKLEGFVDLNKLALWAGYKY